jgi:hypothetical protein
MALFNEKKFLLYCRKKIRRKKALNCGKAI